jgi:broad specificity phosphatase PhoE
MRATVAAPSASSGADMTSRLTFICHASTGATRRSAFPGDEPLDDYGKANAAAFRTHLPARRHSWSSPELRTSQTAELLKLNATVEPKLRDCDYGYWTGQSFGEVSAREPAAVAEWLRDPEACPHGGESLLSLMHRVAGWLAEQSGLSGQTIVVTHASIIRAAIVHAIEASSKSFWRIDIAPLSQTCLSGNEGRWNLSCVNVKMSKCV